MKNGGDHEDRGEQAAAGPGETELTTEAEADSRSVERLTLFSDAVVAIAITLLALELPVPEGSSGAAFWTSVRHDDGHYASFLISFVVIAGAWANHHDVFRYVRWVDARLRFYNTAWLLAIVLTPFATKMLTTAGHQDLDAHALRFSFYALVQVFEAAALLAMLCHEGPGGKGLGAPKRLLAGMTRQCYIIVTGFGLSIPLFFVTTDGWIVWIVVPIVARPFFRWWYQKRAAPGA